MTLQRIANVEIVLEEMLRVGARVIVSFPNLGYQKYLSRLDDGRAPVTDPRFDKKWYNTKDVRYMTIADFEDFCQEKGYKIFRKVALNSETGKVIADRENEDADVVVVVLGR
jgi:methionine biosynthesis protein MetW